MEKIIFFQTETSVGICDREWREERAYENEIKPIKLNMLECSAGYVRELKELLSSDQTEFANKVKEELDNSLYIHSN